MFGYMIKGKGGRDTPELPKNRSGNECDSDWVT